VVALERVAQRHAGVHVVAVASPVAHARQVPGGLELGHDPLGRALGDPDDLGTSRNRASGSRETHSSTCAWLVKKVQSGMPRQGYARHDTSLFTRLDISCIVLRVMQIAHQNRLATFAAAATAALAAVLLAVVVATGPIEVPGLIVDRLTGVLVLLVCAVSAVIAASRSATCRTTRSSGASWA
jgi:hypothetical protein